MRWFFCILVSELITADCMFQLLMLPCFTIKIIFSINVCRKDQLLKPFLFLLDLCQSLIKSLFSPVIQTAHDPWSKLSPIQFFLTQIAVFIGQLLTICIKPILCVLRLNYFNNFNRAFCFIRIASFNFSFLQRLIIGVKFLFRWYFRIIIRYHITINSRFINRRFILTHLVFNYSLSFKLFLGILCWKNFSVFQIRRFWFSIIVEAMGNWFRFLDFWVKFLVKKLLGDVKTFFLFVCLKFEVYRALTFLLEFVCVGRDPPCETISSDDLVRFWTITIVIVNISYWNSIWFVNFIIIWWWTRWARSIIFTFRFNNRLLIWWRWRTILRLNNVFHHRFNLRILLISSTHTLIDFFSKFLANFFG